MELETIELIEKFSEKIKDTDVYKAFIESENELKASDEVAILSYKKDQAIMKYEDALRHFDKNSIEVMRASKVMSEAIFALNNNQIVDNYNKNLAKLNSFLKNIDQELFGDIYD